MKFIIYRDFRAGSDIPFEYIAIDATDIEEAIEIADKMWNACKDNIYLMRIMKKTGKIETPYKAGYKFETYEAILCRRSHGWYRNTLENCEGAHKVNKCWLTNDKSEIWYEIA